MKIFFVVFACFCRCLKKPFCRKYPISTGRNDQLELCKLLNLTEHIANETRQFSVLLL